jgi:predicted kinase
VVRSSETRAADAAPVRVVLVAGLPGAGKSTWAAAQEGATVIDRDEYVLTDDGYNADGREESMTALVEAVESAEPGSRVLFVACLLSPGARSKVCEFVRASIEVPVDFEIVAFDADPERMRQVNEARADTERGSIPADQLEHFIDAWQLPDDAEANEYASVKIV